MNRTQRFLTLWPLAAVLAVPGAALAQETVKIGVLHSLSGTMAISETTLKDTIMMLVDQQNRKGGLLGRKLEAVVVDPASNWPLFAEKARQLLEKDKVAVVFGCWTSVSRKSVLPVFEKDNGLLFYPVQYEGEESSKNVIYTGAAPNQQAIPAVDYLMKDVGVKRWVLEGTDYVYPRTTNKILEAYLKAKGVKAEDISINYTPFGHADWQARVAAIKKFGSAGRKTDVEKVLAALPGLEVPNLTGGVAKLLPNHHITKPVYLGEVRADGQFDVVWKTNGTMPGDAWSDFLPGSKDIEADWVTLKCGNYNTRTKVCSGQSYK